MRFENVIYVEKRSKYGTGNHQCYVYHHSFFNSWICDCICWYNVSTLAVVYQEMIYGYGACSICKHVFHYQVQADMKDTVDLLCSERCIKLFFIRTQLMLVLHETVKEGLRQKQFREKEFRYIHRK